MKNSPPATPKNRGYDADDEAHDEARHDEYSAGAHRGTGGSMWVDSKTPAMTTSSTAMTR